MGRGVGIGLFLVALAVRLPFRTEHLWAHDSVLYSRALEDFDPSEQRPHPPGYYWYVLLIRAVAAVTGDANDAMTLVSAVAGAAAVALLYLLARRVYDERTGRIAALLLLTSVTFWGESAVAYPYTLLATLTIVVALLLWRALDGPAERAGPRFALASLAWGVAVGFRTDLVVLAPAWALVARLVSWRWAALAAAAFAGPFAVWIASSAESSGGLGPFLAAMSEQGALIAERHGVVGRGTAAVAVNIRELARFVGRALYAAAPLVVAFAVLGAADRGLRGPRRALPFLLVWTLAPLPLFLLVHVGEYGHVFSMLPGLCVLAARGAVGIAGRASIPRAHALVAGTAVLANAAIFLFTDTPLAAGDLARRDDGTGEKIRWLERLADPTHTVIASAYDTLIVEHYLGSRYAIVGVDPDRRVAARHRLSCPRRCEQVTTIVWDDLVRTAGPRWRIERMPSGAVLRIAVVRDGTHVRSHGLAIQIEESATD